MRTRFKYASVAVTAVALLAVQACSSSTPTTDQTAESTQNESTQSESTNKDAYVIGYDSYFVGNTWSAQLQAEFEAAADRHKDQISDVVMTQSDNDAQKQISNLQTMIARNVDAIIVTPISPDGIVPVINQAMDAGIKVILNGSAANTDNYTSYVNVDDEAFGAAGAQWLVDKLGGQGDIIAINGIDGIPTSDIRWQGAKKVFDANPGIHIVDTVDGEWDQATTKTAMTSVLAAHPKVNGIWSQGGSMTLGAIEAYEAAGLPLVPMTGEDNNGLLKKWAALIAAGDTAFDCIGVAKPTYIASDSLDQALAALSGGDVTKSDLLEPATITADNLNDFVRPDLSDSLYVNTKLTDEQIQKLFAN